MIGPRNRDVPDGEIFAAKIELVAYACALRRGDWGAADPAALDDETSAASELGRAIDAATVKGLSWRWIDANVRSTAFDPQLHPGDFRAVVNATPAVRRAA